MGTGTAVDVAELGTGIGKAVAVEGLGTAAAEVCTGTELVGGLGKRLVMEDKPAFD